MVVEPETGELRIRAAVGLPEDVSGVTVKPGEGISGKVFESGNGIIVNEGDPMPADSLGVRALRQSNCFLSVPLKISNQPGHKEEVVGVFNLTRKREGNMFTASDLKLVSSVAGTTATQIHNCRLLEAERERQRMEQELELAERIQLGLLPDEPLDMDGLAAGGHCKPARRVGGDLFDYWVQDGTLCFVVGDVSGHDIGAALMAAAFRSVLRSEVAHRQSVASLMARVNSALYADLVKSELFITAFYGEVDVASRQFTFCRAGHPMPLLFQAGESQWLDTGGMLIGVVEDCGFEQRRVMLEPGATVFLFTDGLLEAGDKLARQFGTEGVLDAARRALGLAPQQMAEQVIEQARTFAGSVPPDDDMTALAVRLSKDARM
jgi:serine phosphatase RsbU (regulator of sigma subunit)